MRTFVTGASGFVGRSLCTALAAAGHDVVPVSVRGAIPAFDGAQAVVHLARSDATLTEKVGRAAAHAGARMVFMSSVKVHGEVSDELLVEGSPFDPQNEYARDKVRSEERLRAIAGLRLVVLRPPLVYGPEVAENFRALVRLVGSGLPLPFAGIENRRSLVYVGNLASAVARCLDAASGVFLVSDGEPLSTPQLCQGIAGALGKSLRLFAFPRSFLPRKLTASQAVDDAAIRRALGWTPPFTLAQGLAATVARIG